MRNFKKFLALVLAMLMVSACAVSVSAFDDVAATDKYAKAIEMLADLGVIAGRGDGKFYPEATLTREEAAKIAAVTLAGAQPIEWNEATTRFTDVSAKWSFAYINYVDDEGVMVGTGGDTFAPKRELRIDEALKIAVVIADPAAARKADLEYAKNPSLGWAAFYIDAADTLGLTAGVTVRKYDVPCTRGMFAQFIYNAFDFVEDPNNEEDTNDKFGLQANFGYGEIEGKVTVNSDASIVTIEGVQVTATLFNEALKAAGYTETAADLAALNCKVYMSWFNTGANQKIVDLEVLTTGKVVLYNDADIKFENVYDDLDNNGTFETLNNKYIKIAGVKYEVGVEDRENSTTVIGGTAADTVGIALTIDTDTDPDAEANDAIIEAGTVDVLPKYFKAFLYDDDGDGDFERCDIIEYTIATVKVEDKSGVANYTVKFADGSTKLVNKAADKAAKWSGLAVVADDETPMLIQKKWESGDTVDIIEIAATVTGELTSLVQATSSAPAYAVIAGNNYSYENASVVVPTTTLKQNISVFTINNALVKVAKASFETKEIFLDKATVNEAGNVVLSGFDGSTLAAVTYELTGEYSGGKYVAAVGHYLRDTEANKNFAKYVMLGGTKNSSTGEYEGGKEFVEGTCYELVKTTNGVYYVDIAQFNDPAYVPTGADNEVIPQIDKTLASFFYLPVVDGDKLEVTADYVKVNGRADYINNSAVILIEDRTSVSADNAYNYTYKLATSFAAANGVVADTNSWTDSKIGLIYVTEKGTAVTTTTTIKGIEEGQSIVQILDGHYLAADFDFFTFSAFDIIKGTKVVVKATSADLVEGEFYLVDGDEVVGTKATDWVYKKNFYVATEGVVTTYTAFPTYFKKTGDTIEYAYGDETTYGKATITIYDTGADDVIDFNSDGTVKTLKVAETYTDTTASDDVATKYVLANAYITEDAIIIIK